MLSVVTYVAVVFFCIICEALLLNVDKNKLNSNVQKRFNKLNFVSFIYYNFILFIIDIKSLILYIII